MYIYINHQLIFNKNPKKYLYLDLNNYNLQNFKSLVQYGLVIKFFNLQYIISIIIMVDVSWVNVYFT